jgi:predicted peroxiredoxin
MSAESVLIYAGTARLDRASPAFTVGSSALDMGMEVTILIATSWLCVVRRCGVLGLSRLIERLRAGGARLIACPTDSHRSAAANRMLTDGIECGDQRTFLELAERADIVLAF